MMIIPIPSHKKRFVIDLGLIAKESIWIGIKVYDPTKSFSDYFRRKLFLNKGQRRTIKVQLPVTPEHLELEIVNKSAGDYNGFELQKFDVKEMTSPSFWADENQHRFMDFAIRFSQKAGYLPPGFYDSKDHEFLFQYLSRITDSLGNELVTPARTHRMMPRVQISRKQFKRFTVPIRVAILAHEGCHYLLNTRSEKEADLCGMSYYLNYGFPKIEAVYAATKVFRMFPHSIGEAHVKRTEDILRFIEDFKEYETLKV